MPEAASTIGLFSALFLLASGAIWVGLLRGPLMQRLDGSRASNRRPAQFAIWVLILSLGLSAVAAVVAVGGWIYP
jgi:hypothetical protein